MGGRSSGLDRAGGGGDHGRDGVDDAVGRSGVAASGRARLTRLGAVHADHQVGVALDGDAVLAAREDGLGPVRGGVVVDAGDVLDDEERMALDHARDLEAEGAEGALLEGAHAVDLDGALERPPLDGGGDLVDLDPEDVGDDADHRGPHHHQRLGLQHLGQAVHRAAEADDVADHVRGVVEGVVEQLLDADLRDRGADTAEQAGEDVERPARVDAGDEHRRVADGARVVDHVEHDLRRAGRVQQRVEGGRHHVAPGAQAAVEVAEGLHRPGVGGGGVDDAVDVVGQCHLDVVGGEHAEWPDAGQLPRVLADLRRVGHDHARQLEVTMPGHGPDRRPAHVPRPPHHHSQRHGRRP